MMRSIRKTLRAMLLELKLPPEDAQKLLPVVQHALNHTPSAKLGGRAPITAMTQLPPGNALSAYHEDPSVKEIDPATLAKWREKYWSDLASARDQLHRELELASDDKRDSERKRRNNKKHIRQLHLEVGDYVLVGKVSQAFTPKLQVTWLGPRRIIQTLSDWLFVVEDLRDGSKSQHHASRLKKYAAGAANITQDLLDHVAYVEGGYLVEELRDTKFDRLDKIWKIQVKWFGLSELENSWEPVTNLLEDVPALVHSYVRTHGPTSGNVKLMANAYSLSSSPTHQ
jgi:hypothetical protein